MQKATHNRILLGFFIAAISSLVSGCASQIVVESASTLPDTEAWIFKIDQTVKNGLSPKLNGLVDLDNKVITIRSEPFMDYYRIKTAPGRYYVTLKVYSGQY